MTEPKLVSSPLIPSIENITDKLLTIHYHHPSIMRNSLYSFSLVAININGETAVAENVVFGKFNSLAIVHIRLSDLAESIWDLKFHVKSTLSYLSITSVSHPSHIQMHLITRVRIYT